MDEHGVQQFPSEEMALLAAGKGCPGSAGSGIDPFGQGQESRAGQSQLLVLLLPLARNSLI